MSIELKPCPFCGGEAVIERADKWYCAYCEGCGAEIMTSTFRAKDSAQIEIQRLRTISKWNKRSAENSRIKELEEFIWGLQLDVAGDLERSKLFLK